MKKGLTKDGIVQTAVAMIAEKGWETFSLRELAARLAVRPASLYNHVENVDDLYTSVATLVMGELAAQLEAATAGKEGDAAVRALAEAYYRYGKENPELYKTIIAMRMKEGAALHDAFGEILQPFYAALAAYHLSDEQCVSMHRMLRSLVHGYLMLEEAGYFTKPTLSTAASFAQAVQCYIDGLHAAAAHREGGQADERAE
ncbi:MAG: TetR/AcrR family transcriptional regulator [Peptococcaceae bacterium]|nr:TetR/AcrR family transcriptional regulator [Peptococcaceae bacterium]